MRRIPRIATRFHRTTRRISFIYAETYSIPHGVFMFLGYSEKDETLLKHHNNLTVLDAVSSLDNFMKQEVNNQVRRVVATPHTVSPINR